MGKFKEKVDTRITRIGKMGIILLYVFSRLVVGFGLLTLVGSIFGVVDGILMLQKPDTKYIEVIESEDFEFNLSAIGYTKEEFLAHIEYDETLNAVIADYVTCGIAFVIRLLALLAVYMCAWVVTGAIRKDEDKPFKKENLNALKKAASVLFALYMLEFVFELVFNLPYTSKLGYLLIVCVFVYLFDAGYKLQLKK